MGQYWKVVNLDKKEYLEPHKLGAGLKLWEQLAAHPGTGAALIILCAAQREVRGGGDFDIEKNWHGPERTLPKHSITPGPMPEEYPNVARAVIGRWAGDRIALVGDYAVDSDLAPEHHASLIYGLCQSDEDRRGTIQGLREAAAASQAGKKSGFTAEEYNADADGLEKAQPYTDITDMVSKVIEHELEGRFEGEGWREWKQAQ